MDNVQLPQSVVSPAEQLTELDAWLMSQQEFISMDHNKQLNFLSDMYLQWNTQIRVPSSDFIHLALYGMERLHKTGRMNVIYLIAKALSTTCPDGSDSLLPTSRMPIGLVEHIVNFFTATAVQQIRKHSHISYCILTCYTLL